MGQENSHEILDDSVPPKTLNKRSLRGIAEYIQSKPNARIVVLTGAGLSTAAGIPDFRSPDTGLYANLARLNLPYAEAVFSIDYFREHPEPFYALAKELYPGKFKPTLSHCFIALLAKKGLLLKLFTQNIDCLERAAGVPGDLIVEAHGSFATQRCIQCGSEYPEDLMMEAVENESIPYCRVPECNGLVKPDIVFFGEALPKVFGSEAPKVAQADLVIIIGTSLSVAPFNQLPEFALEGVPRLLLNRERVGSIGSRRDDVCVLSDCDQGVKKLADALGWMDELLVLCKEKEAKMPLDSEAEIEEEESRPTDDKTFEAQMARLEVKIGEINLSAGQLARQKAEYSLHREAGMPSAGEDNIEEKSLSPAPATSEDKTVHDAKRSAEKHERIPAPGADETSEAPQNATPAAIALPEDSSTTSESTTRDVLKAENSSSVEESSVVPAAKIETLPDTITSPK